MRFPENLGVLTQLKALGLSTAILSNGSPDMLASATRSAGMTGLIDHILSVDTVRQFKTSPESYNLVLTVIDAKPGENIVCL